MANIQIDNIIDKVQAILGELKTEGVIGYVDTSDKILDALHHKKVSYPFAFLNPVFFNQNTDSDFRSYDRVYTVAITVIFNNASKQATIKDIARKMEQIADRFQDKITLDGDLQAGWVDLSTGQQFFIEGSKDKVGADLVLNIHTIRDFTFTGQ